MGSASSIVRNVKNAPRCGNPGGLKPSQMLRVNADGVQRTMSRTRLVKADRLRDQPNLSMPIAVRFSITAAAVENATKASPA
jgi:hypothetical protein